MKKRLTSPARLTFLILLASGVLGGMLVGAGSAGTAFPGKNGQIAFVLNPKDGERIFVMNANGLRKKQLTRKPRCKGYNCFAWFDVQPSWSPNGRKIAFSRSRGGSIYQVWVMNADGSRLKQLTHTRGSQAYEANPAWSPDGKKIVFTSRRQGQDDVFVMNANGSGRTQLTHTESSLDAGNPAWSPDGTKIVFDGGGSAVINVMNADGSNVKQLAVRPNNNSGDGSGSAPAWSPDGTRIVYMQPDDSNVDQLWVMSADGSGQRQVTVSGPPRSRHYRRPQSLEPSWSPDGTKIVFWRVEYSLSIDKPTIGVISVMSPDGSGQRVLRKAGNQPSPDWGPVRR